MIILHFIKRFFIRMFKSLLSMYAPTILTIIYAIAQFKLFPELPFWLVPLFLLCMIFVLP